jgi:spore maturation protein CgeB
MKLDIVIAGLTITSSWGNGHATTYRALIKALSRRGHRVTFLERDVPWYEEHRDLAAPSYCTTQLYRSTREFTARYDRLIRDADLVILGSYVPAGKVIGEWMVRHARGVTAFYDIDTPVTLAGLENGKVDYISCALIPRFDLYLSFTGGPTLDVIQEVYGSPRARPLYCAVDAEIHAPRKVDLRWQLGYIGTYSPDRQPALDRMLLEPARRMPDLRFAVAGPQYPVDVRWSSNVDRIEHLPPRSHAEFYCAQRYTLNITRADMIAAGYSPSVRLFEAAACGVPVISDRWSGVDRFFAPGKEILLANTASDVIEIFASLPESRRRAMAAAARKRVLQHHTAEQRASALEDYYRETIDRRPAKKALERAVSPV